MDRLRPAHVWAMRLWFVMLALAILFFHLLPLDTQPRRWAPPDLLIAFTFAWAVRRPDFVPALSIAGVMLTADLLLQRPPGLLALLVLLGSEYLKSRASTPGETTLAGEWAQVCLVLIMITLLYRVLLGITMVQQASILLNLVQMLLTMLAYPFVALITQGVMGVRRPTPGDAETLGVR